MRLQAPGFVVVVEDLGGSGGWVAFSLLQANVNSSNPLNKVSFFVFINNFSYFDVEQSDSTPIVGWTLGLRLGVGALNT